MASGSWLSENKERILSEDLPKPTGMLCLPHALVISAGRFYCPRMRGNCPVDGTVSMGTRWAFFECPYCRGVLYPVAGREGRHYLERRGYVPVQERVATNSIFLPLIVR